MKQAGDFVEESDVLLHAVERFSEHEFAKQTLFKNWSIDDILVHLYFWNLMADWSLNEPDKFETLIGQLRGSIASGSLRQFENGEITVRGHQLRDTWRDHYRDMGQHWSEVDPKIRVKWAGPEMSVRSSMSARQMEIWAHGQAVFDMLGQDRPESDRLKNVVFLCVNAFGWSHKVHGLEIPELMPKLELVSPSGAQWEFGEEGSGSITGDAVAFCQVVTQTRNYLDTDLQIEGETALTWMKHAQCFAGPPETPPAPGTRFKSAR